MPFRAVCGNVAWHVLTAASSKVFGMKLYIVLVVTVLICCVSSTRRLHRASLGGDTEPTTKSEGTLPKKEVSTSTDDIDFGDVYKNGEEDFPYQLPNGDNPMLQSSVDTSQSFNSFPVAPAGDDLFPNQGFTKAAGHLTSSSPYGALFPTAGDDAFNLNDVYGKPDAISDSNPSFIRIIPNPMKARDCIGKSVLFNTINAQARAYNIDFKRLDLEGREPHDQNSLKVHSFNEIKAFIDNDRPVLAIFQEGNGQYVFNVIVGYSSRPKTSDNQGNKLSNHQIFLVDPLGVDGGSSRTALSLSNENAPLGSDQNPFPLTYGDGYLTIPFLSENTAKELAYVTLRHKSDGIIISARLVDTIPSLHQSTCALESIGTEETETGGSGILASLSRMAKSLVNAIGNMFYSSQPLPSNERSEKLANEGIELVEIKKPEGNLKG